MFEFLWDLLSDGERMLTLLVGASIGAGAVGYFWLRHKRKRDQAGL